MIDQLSLETEEAWQKLRFLTKDMEDVLLKSGKKLDRAKLLVSSHSSSTDSFVSSNASAALNDQPAYCSGRIPSIQKYWLYCETWKFQQNKRTPTYIQIQLYPCCASCYLIWKEKKKNPLVLILIKWWMIWWDGQEAIIFMSHCRESANLVHWFILKYFWQTVLII